VALHVYLGKAPIGAVYDVLDNLVEHRALQILNQIVPQLVWIIRGGEVHGRHWHFSHNKSVHDEVRQVHSVPVAIDHEMHGITIRPDCVLLLATPYVHLVLCGLTLIVVDGVELHIIPLRVLLRSPFHRYLAGGLVPFQ
jgi:hypothetical protein